jgi:hypothetical protein
MMTRELTIWEWSRKLESSLAKRSKENIVARDKYQLATTQPQPPQSKIDPSHQKNKCR